MKPATKRLCEGLIVFIITLFLMEVGARRLEPNITTHYEHPLNEYDASLGYQPRPNVRSTVVRKKDDKIEYHAIYSIDEHRRRVTPNQEGKKANRPMLFFGCSFTFGEGVQDNQTLPYYFSQLAPSYRVYNYGVLGYGTQHMLAKLQSTNFSAEVPERGEAVLVYTFIDRHVPRVLGWLRVFWGREFPYYRLAKDGTVMRDGSFASGRPILTFLYDLLWRSALVRYWAGTFHRPIATDNDIKLTARIIEESRKTFRSRFHSERFYVLFYPMQEAQNIRKLIPHLRAEGIHYFDYSMLRKEGMLESLPGDPHPSPNSYRAVATKLAQDIEGSR